MNGDCELCGHWAGKLTLGVCNECIGKFHGAEGETPAARPLRCRNRLKDEGQAYPKSGCEVCKTGGITGCPYERDTPPVIGLAGPAGVGKSKAADYLVERFPHYDKAAFADPVKAMLAEGLGLDCNQLYGSAKGEVDSRYECTPRHIMQTLGTEWGRQLIHPDVWTRAMAGRVAGRRVVIDDVRFPNEAAFVRERGVLVHLEGRGGIEGGHVSETPLERLPGDLVVRNDGNELELIRGLDHALGI